MEKIYIPTNLINSHTVKNNFKVYNQNSIIEVYPNSHKTCFETMVIFMNIDSIAIMITKKTLISPI